MDSEPSATGGMILQWRWRTPNSAGFCVEVAGAWPFDLVYVEIEDRPMMTVPNSVLSTEDS